MNTMSTSKLGGICLLSGGILGFIPFALQIMVGGPSEEGAHIFSFFAQNVIAGGTTSLAYALATVFAVALISFGVYTLKGPMQKTGKKNENEKQWNSRFLDGIREYHHHIPAGRRDECSGYGHLYFFRSMCSSGLR